jgi:thiamine-phosphate pyrophosphorylase
MQRYAISPGALTGVQDGPELERLVAQCYELAADGVDFLLLREKRLSDRELYLLTRRVLAATDVGHAKVMVAGPVQVALAAAADGVHVGTNYALVAQAKCQFTESWVSCSCHSVADVRMAKAAGADVCLFGPVFGKTVDGVEVVPGVGLEMLREACEVAEKDLPVFALGGVAEASAAECVAVGAAGVAGIRMFFGGAPG